MYIALSGMLSDVTRQDVIANNLANVNTVGYKTDRVVNETFSEMFLRNMQLGGAPIGSLSLGTRVAATVTDYSQAPLRNTGAELDVALIGDGFFTVRRTDGTFMFTRNGQFMRSPDGLLMTKTGEYVIGNNGQPIFLNPGKVGIGADGQITIDGLLSGGIAIVTLDTDTMKKAGDNMWTGTPSGNKPAATRVQQGFVEASGVNSVREMVEMIRTLRSYESAQKIIQSIDSTLDKAVNSVGTLG